MCTSTNRVSWKLFLDTKIETISEWTETSIAVFHQIANINLTFENRFGIKWVFTDRKTVERRQNKLSFEFSKYRELFTILCTMKSITKRKNKNIWLLVVILLLCSQQNWCYSYMILCHAYIHAYKLEAGTKNWNTNDNKKMYSPFENQIKCMFKRIYLQWLNIWKWYVLSKGQYYFHFKQKQIEWKYKKKKKTENSIVHEYFCHRKF